MAEPVLTLFHAAVIGLGATGVTAGVAKAFRFTATQARIEQKLDDHIINEAAKFEDIAKAMSAMDEKLPNGELRALLEGLARLEEKLGIRPRDKYKANRNARRKT